MPIDLFSRIFLRKKCFFIMCLVLVCSVGTLLYFHHTNKKALGINLKKTHPDFIGRENYLSVIKYHFQSTNKQSEVHPLLLSGEGGVGKTELAIRFCNASLSDFSFISWIDCSSSESHRTSYIALGAFLGIPIEKKESVQSIISKVHHHLENMVCKKPWLMTFDNADESCTLPQKGNGKVLITSRTNQSWKGAEEIQVSPFTENETIALFQKVAPNCNQTHIIPLGQEFLFFPLVMNQLAHFIGQNPLVTPEECLSLIKKDKLLIINNLDVSNRYPLNLISSWKLTYGAIQKKNPLALEWAQFCSFLHPENIPHSWVAEWLMKYEMIEDPHTCEMKASEILEMLKNYSIIRCNQENDSFSLHRLSQEVLQDDLECLNQKDTVLHYLVHYPHGLNGDELEDNISHWDNLETWSHHASWFLSYCGSIEKNLRIGELHELLGKYKYLVGNYKAALILLEEAKKIKSLFYAEESIEISACNHQLGVTLERLGKYERAENVLAQALDFRKTVYGTSHHTVASSSHSLGWVLVKCGQFKKAEQLFTSALAIREAIYGKDNPYYATTLNYLSWTLYKLGEYDQAKKLAIEALEIRKQLFKENHPSIARSMNDLGVILGKIGEYELSASYHLDAWKMREALFGSIHPDIAHSMYDLAVVYEKHGKLTQAKEVQKKALEMKYYLFDESHPEVANSLHALGIIHIKLNELKEAQSALNKSFEIRQNAFVPHHPKIADSQAALGLVSECLGDYKKAIELYQSAYQIRCQSFGKKHHDTIDVEEKIQNVHSKQKALSQ